MRLLQGKPEVPPPRCSQTHSLRHPGAGEGGPETAQPVVLGAGIAAAPPAFYGCSRPAGFVSWCPYCLPGVEAELAVCHLSNGFETLGDLGYISCGRRPRAITHSGRKLAPEWHTGGPCPI